MSDSVETFERGVVFRMGRGVGLVATILGVFMVIGGGFVVTKTVTGYVAARRPPSVLIDEVRSELKPDPRGAGSSEAASVGEDALPAIADCPSPATDGLATTIGNDQEEKPTSTEQVRLNRIVRSNCEDLDEAYRAAFLAEGAKIVASAPKGRKAAYWDAFRKIYERKATRALLQRTSAGAETLTSTMLAGTLTIGGFVIVALFGALLALLSLERLVRAGGLVAKSPAADQRPDVAQREAE